MSNKIDNTFSKAAIELAKLEKAFAENSKLEKAVMESNGDVSVIAEVRSHIAQAIKSLTPQTITEGVLDDDDDDGFMARSQLYFLARDAIKLHSVIDDRDDLEPWVQSKIAQASKDMDSVRRYTEYNAMKAQVEPEMQPEMQPAPEVESLEEDPVDRKMQVTNADKEGNTPAWQRYKAGDPRYEYKAPVKEFAGADGPGKASMPQGIALAGDSIWLNRDGMQYADDVVTITDYKVEETDGMIEVWVEHNAPWEIYTDSGFAKGISRILGIDVDWSEQGMQAQGVAHLEGDTDLDEAIRPVRSAASKLNQIGQGVRNKTNDETPMKVGEQKKKKKYKEAVAEETKFDDKPEHSELKTVAQDMFKNALANAKKKARK
tara:strand:+ start:2662 stop:3786 length:1125 start_codon:yes stop_codon:yes gene_type:complete